MIFASDFSVETTKFRKQRANIMYLKKKKLLKSSISSKAMFTNKINLFPYEQKLLRICYYLLSLTWNT